MIAEEVGFLGAFLAGLLSFLSPCVLPLVPAYLSMVTGLTLEELREGSISHKRVLLSCLLFVLGFSIVFVALGATASAAGQFLSEHRRTLNLFLGVVIVVLGFFISGLVRIPALYRERRFRMRVEMLSSLGPLAATVMGAAFALGWTPCVGPILSSILAYAAASGSLGRGVLLLGIYSAGLGVPFIAVGAFFSRAVAALDWFKRNQRKADLLAGGLLILLGILLILDSLGIFTLFA